MFKSSITQGFVAGCMGAVILVTIMYVMELAGQGEPGFVTTYNTFFLASPAPPTDEIIASLLFILSGGVWGIFYAMLVKESSVVKGMLFGFLPTLWLWVAVNAFMGKPLFNDFAVKGLIMPLVFNMLIWGGFVGWFMNRGSKSSHTTIAGGE